LIKHPLLGDVRLQENNIKDNPSDQQMDEMQPVVNEAVSE
jgi:hypothetical protein